MAAPKFIEEKPVSLADVKELMGDLEKRDKELNFRANKVKEYLEAFENIPSVKKKDELYKKLKELNLTRLKEEHIMKIIDFLPTTANDLKIVLQAYPLSLAKKDQDLITETVKGTIST
jgi:DNA-directed RNA polymerase subunit F